MSLLTVEKDFHTLELADLRSYDAYIPFIIHEFVVSAEWHILLLEQLLNIFPDAHTSMRVSVTESTSGVVVALRSKVTVLAQIFVNLNPRCLIIGWTILS